MSSRLLEKQLIFAGHCVRSDQPVSDLVFLGSHKNGEMQVYAWCWEQRQLLLKKTGKVDGLVVSDHELVKLMKNRNEWRLRIRAIVFENMYFNWAPRLISRPVVVCFQCSCGYRRYG